MPNAKNWQIRPRLSPQQEAALSEKIPLIVKQVLVNRGIYDDDAAREFLYFKDKLDHDPFGMLGMATAVERIEAALPASQSIAIYGDYDVDGVTATALLVETLNALGARVTGYIPNRFEEGYGLNNKAMEDLRNQGVELVITVDCGIRSPREAQYARELGLALIISDHHQPSEGELPPALAVINPKQIGDRYPDKDLAGVGIAYKIAQALLTKVEAPAGFSLEKLLDLVALGTVADLAPLRGENRSLVHRGMKEMTQTHRQGLFSLAAVAEIKLEKVSAATIGFSLGPRLNAAGRLKEALAAFELLVTSDPQRAGELAQLLNVQNRERQAITREIQAQAERIALAEDTNAFLLFAADPEFNPGVIGLAASRLTELYYRPAIVAATNEGETRGSCRSIPEFHITNALDQCADLLVRHGGHKAAAGFTVRNENLPELVTRLKQIATEELSGRDLKPTLIADMEVSLGDIRPDLYNKYLRHLEPTGQENPNAVFVARNVKVKFMRQIGIDLKHLKMQLEDESGVIHDAIAFNHGALAEKKPTRVDVLFTYEVNEFNGRVGFQLNIRDVRAAEEEG